MKKKFFSLAMASLMVGSIFTACDTEKTPQSDTTKLWPAPDKATKKLGYINAKGEWAITPQYEDAYTFSNGVALVSVDGTKYGYIDKNGNLSGSFEGAGQHYEGLAIGIAGEKFGFINTSAEWEIQPLFDAVDDFSDGLARFYSTDAERYGFMNKKGETVLQPIYERISSFSEGLASFRTEEGKYGFMDKDGNFAIPATFDYTENFSDGLALYRVGDYSTGRYGFLDKKGKSSIAPAYENAKSFFQDGLAPVKQNGKWGFINKKGDMKITPIYDFAFPFCEGMAVVMVGENCGAINTKGDFVIPATYRSDENSNPFFHNGLIFIGTIAEDYTSVTYQYINKKNEVIWSTTFDMADMSEVIKKATDTQTEKKELKLTNNYGLKASQFK